MSEQTISLHAYRANTRLTQSAHVSDCQLFTWMVREIPQTKKRKERALPPAA
jgi:hypothetical protein